MFTRLNAGALVGAFVLMPSLALAQALTPPGVGPDDRVPRATYRQAMNQFPPPGGRYGGGFIEYVLTGGRPEPVAPQYAATSAPNWVLPAYAQPGHAPYGGTGDQNPVRAFIDGVGARAPARPAPSYNQPAYPAPAYAAPAYAQPVYAPPPTYSPTASVPAAAGGGAPYDPLQADPGLATRPIDPVYMRQVVAYSGRERQGTIVIDTPDKFLYLVQSNGQAIRYGIGVGRPGFSWAGTKTISRKAEWPDWTPPPQMLKRRPDLPRHMAGGQANPLGARALYLGSSMYRIHGTNEPYTIGTNVSSGCIRMMNQDVIDLYGRVGVGTRVLVL